MTRVFLLQVKPKFKKSSKFCSVWPKITFVAVLFEPVFMHFILRHNLTDQCPKLTGVIHMYQMAEFVYYNIVYSINRCEQQPCRKV